MSKRINWSGVFPAVTTQFNDDFTINLDKTHQVISNVIRDGVSGLVVCGSVGENTSLTAEEKIAVTEVAVDASRGRVPVICGVAEFTSVQAAKVANAVRKVGVDGGLQPGRDCRRLGGTVLCPETGEHGWFELGGRVCVRRSSAQPDRCAVPERNERG